MPTNGTTKYRLNLLEKAVVKVRERIEHAIESFNKDKKLWLKLSEEHFVTRREFETTEDTLNDLCNKVDLIRTNELPHINAGLSSLKARVNVSTALNIGAIVVGAILLRMLK